MSKMIDNLIAFKILYMLVTPFEKTDAFRLGIVDKDGNAIKKTKELKTSEEKEAYTQLHKLVFSLKRLIGKVPGGKSQLASIVAAYYLIKECNRNKSKPSLSNYYDIIDLIENKNFVLVEELLEIENFMLMYEEGEGGAAVSSPIANKTGSSVSTDIPVISRKKAKIVNPPKLLRRFNGNRQVRG